MTYPGNNSDLWGAPEGAYTSVERDNNSAQPGNIKLLLAKLHKMIRLLDAFLINLAQLYDGEYRLNAGNDVICQAGGKIVECGGKKRGNQGENGGENGENGAEMRENRKSIPE